MNDSRPTGGMSDTRIGPAFGGRSPRASAFSEAVTTPAAFAEPHPEYLAQPAIVMVRHDEIVGDPFNIRDSLPSIVRLARSIYQHGLLENLVVIELPSERRQDPNGPRFELKAGSRRFEAIRRLIHEGIEPPKGSEAEQAGVLWKWPAEKLIPALVLGSGGHYEHLVENVERSSPHPWEIGRRLSEILSAGVSSRELGERLGRSNGWVSRYAHIGRGLAPELIELIVREHVELRLGELSGLASIRDAFGDPDGPAQLAAYQARRKRKRKRSRPVDPQSFRASLKRLQYLRGEMPIPALIRPLVTAVVAYLDSGERPNFRAHETALFERLRTLSPHTEIEDS